MSNIYTIGREGVRKINEELDTPTLKNKDKPDYDYKEKHSGKLKPSGEYYETFENPIQAIYEATVRALTNIKVFENSDYEYEPFYVKPAMQDDEAGYVNFFKTIKIDTGDFGRVIKDLNHESEETAFPAVFIHFINIRYLVAQQRIGEGRATMRLRFVLNNLNNEDRVVETMPLRVMQLVNRTIQFAKTYEPSFDERINITYMDMPETTGTLQPYWVDYEVWFRDLSGWVYNDYKRVNVVVPPFTNHSDSPETNINNHEDHDSPTYEDSVTII